MSWSQTGFDAGWNAEAASSFCREPSCSEVCPECGCGNFIVRETLVHEEFVEALIRLHEEKLGLSQDQRDFGLPKLEDESSDWWGDWYEDQERGAEEQEAADGTAAAAPPSLDGAAYKPILLLLTKTTQFLFYVRRLALLPVIAPENQEATTPLLRSLLLAPSTRCRWRTVSSWAFFEAGAFFKRRASHEEKRDILGATKNSLDYEVISAALQTLWDDQLLTVRHQPGGAHFMNYHETQMDYEDDWWGDDGSWWHDASYAGYDDGSWWQEDEDFYQDQIQAATIAVCNGPHLPRECPDRRHPGPARGFLMKGKGKGKPYHANSLEDFYFQNKGKGKGKSKKGMFLEAQAQWYKGKGKSKSLRPPRPVNAYVSDMYLGGLEMSNTMDLAAVASSSTRPELGMVDCGATASAAPDAVVKGLISSILECDKGARIDITRLTRVHGHTSGSGTGVGVGRFIVYT